MISEALNAIEGLSHYQHVAAAVVLVVVPMLSIAAALHFGTCAFRHRFDPESRAVHLVHWIILVGLAVEVVAALVCGWSYAAALLYLWISDRIPRLPVSATISFIAGPSVACYIFVAWLIGYFRDRGGHIY